MAEASAEVLGDTPETGTGGPRPAGTGWAPRRQSLAPPEFDRLAEMIEGTVGIKMPPEKKGLLELRLSRRLRALGLESFESYCRIVFDEETGATEMGELLDCVTTNKTDFFREPEHFERLVDHVVPDLTGRYPSIGQRRPLRVWSAGCSSGEEPYTIGMVLESLAEEGGPDFEVTSTDLSGAKLAEARTAIYDASRAAAVPDELRTRYMMRSKEADGLLVRVAPEIRRRTRFGRLNLLEPLEFAHPFDIVFCRNVLIYFRREVQIAVLQRICDVLVDGGYLFVGHSETLHGMGLPLSHVAPTVYRKETPA